MKLQKIDISKNVKEGSIIAYYSGYTLKFGIVIGYNSNTVFVNYNTLYKNLDLDYEDILSEQINDMPFSIYLVGGLLNRRRYSSHTIDDIDCNYIQSKLQNCYNKPIVDEDIETLIMSKEVYNIYYLGMDTELYKKVNATILNSILQNKLTNTRHLTLKEVRQHIDNDTHKQYLYMQQLYKDFVLNLSKRLPLVEPQIGKFYMYKSEKQVAFYLYLGKDKYDKTSWLRLATYNDYMNKKSTLFDTYVDLVKICKTNQWHNLISDATYEKANHRVSDLGLAPLDALYFMDHWKQYLYNLNGEYWQRK